MLHFGFANNRLQFPLLAKVFLFLDREKSAKVKREWKEGYIKKKKKNSKSD